MIDPRFWKGALLLGCGVAGLLLFVGILFLGFAAAEMRRWRGKL